MKLFVKELLPGDLFKLDDNAILRLLVSNMKIDEGRQKVFLLKFNVSKTPTNVNIDCKFPVILVHRSHRA